MRLNVSINVKNFIRELPKFFNKKDAYIYELAQNSYRAGATKIDITVRNNIYRTADNGHGITDMRDVFMLAQSGWENDDITQMEPAGMGIFSAFLSAQKVQIITWRTENNVKIYQTVFFTKEQILSAEPINIKSINTLDIDNYPEWPSGTIVELYDHYVFESIESSIADSLRYMSENISGESLAITLNGSLVETEDYINPKDKKVLIRQQIDAGELILLKETGNDNNGGWFCGQLIAIDYEYGDNDTFPYRLKVRPGGLTPRLPDRSAFVKDDKMEKFHADLDKITKKYCLALDEVSQKQFEKYFQRLKSQFVPADIRGLSINYDILDMPDSRYTYPALSTILSRKTENIKKITNYDFIITDKYDCNIPKHVMVLSALHAISERVGVINNKISILSRHPEYLSRKRTLDDFKVHIKKSNKTEFNDNEIWQSKIILEDTKTKKRVPINGLVLEATDLNDNIVFYWGKKESYLSVDPDTVTNDIKELCPLVARYSDDTHDDYAFDTDFTNCIEKPYLQKVKPGGEIAELVKNAIEQIMGQHYSKGIPKDVQKSTHFEVTVKDKDVSFTVKTKNHIYTLKNNKITRKNRL